MNSPKRSFGSSPRTFTSGNTSAGINIVTTADWITGWHRDTNHPHPSGKPVTRLLAEACEKGGSTFYGTGMNPGVNQILGVVCSADVAEIERRSAARLPACAG